MCTGNMNADLSLSIPPQNVINTFTQTAKNARCNFYGNVNVGKDVSVQELQQAYHAVILVRSLRTKNSLWASVLFVTSRVCYHRVTAQRETGGWGYLEKIWPVCTPPKILWAGTMASQIVERYVSLWSSFPFLLYPRVSVRQPFSSPMQFRPDLNCETAVILGQGNVALDIARILLSPTDILKVRGWLGLYSFWPYDEMWRRLFGHKFYCSMISTQLSYQLNVKTVHLQKTDITQPALEALTESKVRRVLIVGRRGPMQVACTIKVCEDHITMATTENYFFQNNMRQVTARARSPSRNM